MTEQLTEIDVVLPLEASDREEAWRRAVAGKLRVPVQRVMGLRLRKRSIDARRKGVKVQLKLEVSLDKAMEPELPHVPGFPRLRPGAKRLLIVGCGPAGMFAALRAIELGWKPIILERGKDAMTRRFDLAPILRQGVIDEESNYCFGEGGAGTYSDGKLYTRATKRGPVRRIYEILVEHGAPAEILIDAHPHVGSNLLPNVVRALRQTILAAGGEILFQSKVTGMLRSGNRIRGVRLADGSEFAGEAVILATGHSARDIYRLLRDEGILMEQKPFAVGVRIEHPQALIDSIQYHQSVGQPRHRLLPAASYRLATKIGDRGVHSFCMCPGGFIVPAATKNDEVVVNGMSLARRDSPFANSGFVVTVEPVDTSAYEEEHGLLAGIAFQKDLERNAALAGGGRQKAPSQGLLDFLSERDSSHLPSTSYFPGLTSAPLHAILPRGMVTRLQTALRQFGKSMRGYLSEEACLIGFETRTSSPLRIPRDPETLEHPSIAGLFPCGEGAGFAGGIVSAALDGRRCAEQIGKLAR